MLLNLKRILNPKFILVLLSLIIMIVGFILYFSTFRVFGYSDSKWVIGLTIIALWLEIIVLANQAFANKPFYVSFIYILIPFMVMIIIGQYLIPCLSPIGIYFTVNMGDMETYALGVPRCIAGVALYLVSAIALIGASFFKEPSPEVLGGNEHE